MEKNNSTEDRLRDYIQKLSNKGEGGANDKEKEKEDKK